MYKILAKREEKEKKKQQKEKKQQKAHKNRNGELGGVIKTANVVKIAEDIAFCGRERRLGFAGRGEVTTASVREFWSFML